MRIASVCAAVALTALVSVQAFAEDGAARLALNKGDHIAIVGNTFAERLGLFGNFETRLHASLPEHQLTVRNLGWPADTSTLQPRPLNFGEMPAHLAEQKADVVFLCLGMNESFAGAAGLAQFQQDLTGLIKSLQEQKFNGRGPPRLVLVSPIPHENLGGLLPDPAEHNKQLAAYTEAMRKLAGIEKIPFVDLYTTVAPLMTDSQAGKLTANGIHLNQYGDWVMALVMMDQLGLAPETIELQLDAQSAKLSAKGAEVASSEAGRFQVTVKSLPPAPAPDGFQIHAAMLARQPHLQAKNLRPGRYTLRIDGQEVLTADQAQWAAGVRITAGPWAGASAALRDAVNEKSRQFYFRWRAVNGEYIYGRRKEPFGVVSFPPEMKQLDEMVAQLDQRIWAAAKAQPHALELVPAGS